MKDILDSFELENECRLIAKQGMFGVASNGIKTSFMTYRLNELSIEDADIQRDNTVHAMNLIFAMGFMLGDDLLVEDSSDASQQRFDEFLQFFQEHPKEVLGAMSILCYETSIIAAGVIEALRKRKGLES